MYIPYQSFHHMDALLAAKRHGRDQFVVLINEVRDGFA